MKRHTFDPTSFLAGLVLAAVGVGYIVVDSSQWHLDPRWVLPVVLIGLGLAGIAGAVGGLRKDTAVEPSAPEPSALVPSAPVASAAVRDGAPASEEGGPTPAPPRA